jgi:hypothetical protein
MLLNVCRVRVALNETHERVIPNFIHCADTVVDGTRQATCHVDKDGSPSAPAGVFQLPLGRVKTTSAKSFWEVVRHAARKNALLSALDDGDRGAQGGPSSEPLVASFKDTIVMLPLFLKKVWPHLWLQLLLDAELSYGTPDICSCFDVCDQIAHHHVVNHLIWSDVMIYLPAVSPKFTLSQSGFRGGS